MGQAGRWNAGLYDDKHSFVWKLAAGLLDLLDAQPRERILDIGCGTGHLTAKIAESGARVVGTDLSPEMIRQAREKYPEIRFEVMDARKLALDEQFDAVFSNATLHWVKEPEQVITAVANVLRPGGRFVAEFGGKGNIAQFVAAAERAWKMCGFVGEFPFPWYYPSIGEYARLLESHGLEVTYGALFERPTALEDGEHGLRNWIEMFGAIILRRVPANRREEFVHEIERLARETLYRNGSWVLDYRRLRVTAVKL
jgi:trans-aconitate methyltransferase